MQTEHYLIHLQGITSKSRAKICAQWGIFKAPDSIKSVDHSKVAI